MVTIHLYCYFNQRENRIILERKFLELKILTAILFYIVVVQLSYIWLFLTQSTWSKWTSDFSVFCYHPEFAQTHVHRVGDAIQPPVIPFSSCLQFPSIRVFSSEPALQSGGQSIGASASASVLPMNIHGWFPLGLTDLISLLSLKSLLQHHSLKASVLQHTAFFTKEASQTAPKGTDEFSVSTDANTICHQDSTPAHQGLEQVTGIVVAVLAAQSCLTLCDPMDCSPPWTVACQAPLSMGFSKQEYWSGLPFPFPEDLPDPGIEPRSPALQAEFLPPELEGRSGKSTETFSMKRSCWPRNPTCWSGKLLLFHSLSRISQEWTKGSMRNGYESIFSSNRGDGSL